MANQMAIIKNVDMSEDMQSTALEVAQAALEKHTVERDVAAHIKKEFDRKFGPTWHCVCGRNFGSYISHESHKFIYFYQNQIAILLYKSG